MTTQKTKTLARGMLDEIARHQTHGDVVLRDQAERSLWDLAGRWTWRGGRYVMVLPSWARVQS